MFDLIVGARAVHFASSILVAGAAIFSLFVVAPVLDPSDEPLARKQRQLDRLMLAALGFAIASGVLWLLVLAAEAGEVPIAEAWRDGTAWTFFTDTQFGRVSELRLALAVLIVGSVVVRRRLPSPSGVAASALLGAGFVASLAWCGHAGGGLGLAGTVHMANDAAHLLTAAAWVGGLLPLLLLLGADLEVAPAARHRLVRRFSSVSLMAVASLVLSGLINSWFLLSGMRDLVDTNYGRLILAKAALFLLMLAFAAANRFWLTPSLLPANATTSAGKDALRYLRLFVAMEVVLGTAVICVVAVLGQLPPPLHMHP